MQRLRTPPGRAVPWRHPAGPAGPELRIGPLNEDVVELTPGERLTFVCGDGVRTGMPPASHPGWGSDAVQPDSILYLADESVRLRVVDVRAPSHEVEVEIEVGGAPSPPDRA